MFKLSSKTTFEQTVKTKVLGDKGSYVNAQFTVIFSRLNQTEIDSMIAEITKRPDQMDENEERLSDIAYAKRLLVGFGKDICDASGEPLDFNEGNLDLFLNEPGVASAVVRTFFDTIGGLRAKN